MGAIKYDAPSLEDLTPVDEPVVEAPDMVQTEPSVE